MIDMVNDIINDINREYDEGYIARPIGKSDIWQELRIMKSCKLKPHHKRYAEMFCMRNGVVNGGKMKIREVSQYYGMGNEAARQIIFKCDRIIRGRINERLKCTPIKSPTTGLMFDFHQAPC